MGSVAGADPCDCQLFDELDKNNDGVISRAEWQQVRGSRGDQPSDQVCRRSAVLQWRQHRQTTNLRDLWRCVLPSLESLCATLARDVFDLHDTWLCCRFKVSLLPLLHQLGLPLRQAQHRWSTQCLAASVRRYDVGNSSCRIQYPTGCPPRTPNTPIQHDDVTCCNLGGGCEVAVS